MEFKVLLFLFVFLGACFIMYHTARYHDVFKMGNFKKEVILVTGEEQKKIFTNLAITLFLSGIIAIISVLFRESSAVTAWVLPIIIIISSLLFNNRKLLIGTTIVGIGTQILMWLIKPNSYVLVNELDYIVRIVIILAVFFIGSVINRIYIAKMREYNYQIEFQKIVSDISYQFRSLDQENFDQKLNNLLEKIGSFFSVDRTYLFSINYNNDTMTYSNEWCNTGINKEVATIKEMPIDRFPWWLDQLDRYNLVNVEDVDFMPKEASVEQEHLHRQDVKSLLCTYNGDGKIQAFIGIESVSSTKKWSEENIDRLNIIANILSSGIIQIKADKKIEFLAYYDHLTKLPNQFLFEDRVNQAINLSNRTGTLTSIISIDLDNFKSINDTIGYKGRDFLLREVAKKLVGVIRKTDTVARFSGDEFMVMINNISDYHMVVNIADKIMGIFSEMFLVNGQEFLITASAGIAIYPVDGENSEILVKNADIAMHKAKAKGKNQYALCTKVMKDEVKLSFELSNDLYRALDRDELIVYYQAQIDLVTKKITGMEALLRWMHPTKGMIYPGIFIPIAEKNALINSIGEWVFKTACIQNKKWQDMGLAPMDIAINLSAIQIINPKLSSNLESIIKEVGLNPKYIELEITESIAIKETNYVIESLNKLKKLGVSIAIDDFGTEYSSLSRLKLLPIDRIKIDRQFVQGLESNEKDKAITMIIINLAKSLGMNVLAEGVETQGQLDFLKQEMCDKVQGFYYYKPMPADEMEKILVELDKIDAENALKLLKINPITQI